MTQWLVYFPTFNWCIIFDAILLAMCVVFIYQVFQRRAVGRTSFYRDWGDYAAGFGDVGCEHWLGG